MCVVVPQAAVSQSGSQLPATEHGLAAVTMNISRYALVAQGQKEAIGRP